MSDFERLVERYRSGEVPWDQSLPPPEIVEQLDNSSPGKMLDLGCGYGRASIHAARQGWLVDAVDFVPQAIEVASARAAAAGVGGQISFYCDSVANLGFLDGQYDLAVDVGCLHALDEAELRSYSGELARCLKPGSPFILYVRLAAASEPTGDGPRGISESVVRETFGHSFTLDRVIHGKTQVEASAPWSSAWFHFRRRQN